MIKRIALAAAALIFAAGLGPNDQAAPGLPTVIYAGKLLADPATGKVTSQQTITVKDGRIDKITDGYVAPTGAANIVDLKDSFVLPGLIDCHVHLLSQSGPTGKLDDVTKTSADLVIDGSVYAMRTLKAGFTTVADVGDDNEAIFALRNGIASGKIAGPRILASGSIVTPEGGHADVHGYRPDIMAILESPTACSGADTCRKVVRRQIQAGADLIKIVATGGVLDDSATGVDQQFTDEEMAAIVQTAHSMGRMVKAHAHGAAGINAALKAGVDSIEHGTYLDDDSIKLFKAKGAWLVPTLMAGDFVAKEAAKPDTWMSPAVKAKALQVGPNMLDMGRRAHAAGVKMAFGTDSGVSPHGGNAFEFTLLVKAGFSTIDAIRMATTWAAEHLRLSSLIGSLAPGKAADLIAVKGDPLNDISELRKVSFVMKGGVVYK